ncbi:CASP-LIKE PROTEIN 4D2 [Salix viminalis]|uniref:CASP-like protein n=1 Tax=Salix viminalis TaxID=40686 RepID=A0A9Q0Z3Y1_SALVM|nr:CASP-LIKE PROTEIN 4D2 [Salix viminalis]
MAPPPPSMSPRMTVLILRVLTFAFLLISIAILTTNTSTLETGYEDIKIRFKDVSSYRYMLAANVIGMAYTILQVAFTLNHIIKRNAETSGDGNLVFDFYGDKVISYILATGAAAALGATSDMKPLLALLGFDNFVSKGYASASLLFLGFVCTAILSVFSSYALPKKV